MTLKCQKMQNKNSCSDSHANETHLWPGEYRLKVKVPKKMQNASTSEPYTLH
jgi:hypothetical protein